MDLDTRSLELLEAVAAHGTLTAASRRLHVSQPALSQRLTGLEAQVGLRLFDRQGRRLVPTVAGTRLLQSTAVVLAELRSAARDLDDLRHGRDGIVRVTSQCSTNYQWLPPVIAAYAGAWPGVEVRIETVAGDEPVTALLAGEVDVAIVAKSRPSRRRPVADPAVRGRHGGRRPPRPPVGRPGPRRRRGLRRRPPHRVRQLRPGPGPGPPPADPARRPARPRRHDAAHRRPRRRAGGRGPGRGGAARVGRAAPPSPPTRSPSCP